MISRDFFFHISGKISVDTMQKVLEFTATKSLQNASNSAIHFLWISPLDMLHIDLLNHSIDSNNSAEVCYELLK